MLDTAVTTLLNVDKVSQVFSTGSGESRKPVLDNVSMSLKTGEIVSLLGRSGCGKSTLLRIISGLIQPTEGTVTISGAPVTGPAEEVAMVFQSFALFPWLNVLDNVEIGPRANGVPLDETRQRALKAIDTIGLDGFESAYPKELSGGMRQRVGFARALVMQPKILLMDEPFSALDVLTAETLRTDLLDLWHDGRMPIKSILMVTHNIEEAVLMSDRILVLSSNPGRIASEISVTIPQPRDRLDPDFRALVDKIYALMTQRPDPSKQPTPATSLGLAMSLPLVSTNSLAGMLEEIAAPPYNGKADLPHLAEFTGARNRRPVPAGRDLAAPEARRVRGGRHQTDAARPALRRHGCGPAQEGVWRAAPGEHPASLPYQAGSRRTTEPPGAGHPLSGGARGLHVGRLRRPDSPRDHQSRPLWRAFCL